MNESRCLILIVEDDAPTAGVFRRALAPVGDSETAERGDQVFSMLVDSEPQVILLDIVLEGETLYSPETAGIQILQEIRASKSLFGEIPVIVVTALTDPETEARCRELGAIEFLPKPVDLRTLREAVARLTRQQPDRKRKPVTVFISSTTRDLVAERSTVRRAVQGLGEHYLPVLAEDWAASPDPLETIWRRKAQECDVFILLLGKEYGVPSRSTGKSPIEDEYNRARKAGKPILVFEKTIRARDRDPELRSFLVTLRNPQTGHFLKSFSDLAELYDEVQKALRGTVIANDRAPGVVAKEQKMIGSAEGSKPHTQNRTILFLAADPKDTPLLELDEEIRAIEQKLRTTEYRDHLLLVPAPAARFGDLQSCLLRYKPDVVHFSGHGSASGELLLQDDAGNSHPIQPETLSRLFSVLKDSIQCVVLNACYTEQQARTIADHIPCVIGMSRVIDDHSAIRFAAAFYEAIGYGRSLQTAFSLGCVQAGVDDSTQEDVARLFALRDSAKNMVLVQGA